LNKTSKDASYSLAGALYFLGCLNVGFLLGHSPFADYGSWRTILFSVDGVAAALAVLFVGTAEFIIWRIER
jgi:hypothetical protein